MTMTEHGGDAAVRSIVEMKRGLTDLKLEALLRDGGTAPAADIHDIDAIVAEVATGMEARRTATGDEPTSLRNGVCPATSTV